MTNDDTSETTPDSNPTDRQWKQLPKGWTPTRRQLKRLLSVVGVVVLVAVVLPFVVYAVPQVVGAEHSYVILSGSMEPTASPGDVIVVDEVEPSAIERGDVITFRRAGESRTTTHRVIEVVDRDGGVAFRTKGDNNEDPDPQLVSPDQVQGRVMTVGGHPLVIPYVGYVVQFAGTQTGFVLLFVVPMALLVGAEIWNFVSSARSRPGEGEPTDAAGEGRAIRDASGGPDGTGGDPDGKSVVPGGRDAGSDETDASSDGTAAGTDGADPDPDGTAAGPEADGGPDGRADDAITFRAAELRFGLVVLGAFVAYSLWVAYARTEVWSIGVATSAIVALLMVAGLYFLGGPAGDEDDRPDPPPEGDSGGVQVRIGLPPAEALRKRHQPVASIETLGALAAATGEPIFKESDGDMCYVPGKNALYVHNWPPSDDRSTDGDASEGDVAGATTVDWTAPRRADGREEGEPEDRDD